MTEASVAARAEPPPTHPEEIKSVYELRIGSWLSIQASARITPAGVIALGISGAMVTLACAALVRRR